MLTSWLNTPGSPLQFEGADYPIVAHTDRGDYEIRHNAGTRVWTCYHNGRYFHRNLNAMYAVRTCQYHYIRTIDEERRRQRAAEEDR